MVVWDNINEDSVVVVLAAVVVVVVDLILVADKVAQQAHQQRDRVLLVPLVYLQTKLAVAVAVLAKQAKVKMAGMAFYISNLVNGDHQD
jgi:hypothetical protein